MAKEIEPFYTEFGKIIRAARLKKGMSQAELGAPLGMHRASVANIENARQRTLAHQMVQFCQILDIDMNVFLPRKVRPEPKVSDEDLLDELQRKLGKDQGNRIFEQIMEMSKS